MYEEGCSDEVKGSQSRMTKDIQVMCDPVGMKETDESG